MICSELKSFGVPEIKLFEKRSKVPLENANHSEQKVSCKFLNVTTVEPLKTDAFRECPSVRLREVPFLRKGLMYYFKKNHINHTREQLRTHTDIMRS